MTRLLTEGFEFRDFLRFQATANTTIETTVVRSGNASARCGTGYLSYTFSSAPSEIYFRAACYFTSINTDVFIWYDSSNNQMGKIRLNSSGLLDIYVGTTLQATGTKALLMNTWYVLEVHVLIANTNGNIAVRIDNVSDASFTGDTQPGTPSTIARLVFNSNINYTYFDDIAINNTLGTSDNSWAGDGRIVLMLPNANGDVSQLTGSDGNSVDNYLNVDEVPHDSDTTYNESSTAGQYDLYNLQNPSLGSSPTILRVWVEARVRELTAAGDSVQLGIKTNAVEYWSSNIPTSTSYAALVGTDYTTNPNTGSAWTTTQLDALQAGIKVV